MNEKENSDRGNLKMLNSRKSLILVAVALMVGAGAIQAATLEHSALEPGQFVVRDIIHPLAPQSITQNVDPNTLTSGSSVACSGGGITTDNHWWRLFDLDTDHNLNTEMCVKNVDYGIEVAVGPTQNISATVFCLDEGLPFLNAFLTQVGTATQPQPDADLEFFNIEVNGCCTPETQDMALDMHTQDCLNAEANCLQLFIGCNNLGQTHPSYVHAEDCGLFDPTDLAGIGFPNAHLVYVVNGNGEGGTGDGGSTGDGGGGTGDGGGGGVPASTGFGVMLMVLALLGTSAYFLRRKATN